MTWFVIFGCIFSVIITGYLDLFAGIIIKDKMYLEGLFIVPVLLIANLFSGIYNNLSIWYKLTDMTRYGMFISIVGAITTIITLFIFVPVFGIMGGAISTLITYVLMALVSWYLGHKYYPVSYDITKIAVYILFAALSFLVFRGDLMVNTAMILAFIALVYYLERKEFRVVLLSKK